MTSPMEMDKLLHVAQSCAPPEAIQLIVQVTEDPHTHTFAKLAEAPTIQKLLRLYTTGTWADYLSMAHQLPSLSAAQVAKLRQLTILSLAYQERSLSYATMCEHIGLAKDLRESVRILEELIIEALYQNLFTGRLDGVAERLDVHSVTPRDVPRTADTHNGHDAVFGLLQALRAWRDRSSDAITALDTYKRQVEQKYDARAQTMQEDHAALTDALRNVAQSDTGMVARMRLQETYPDAMDVEANRRTHSKRRSKRTRA